MTGPEHYAEAERLLSAHEPRPGELAAAQVHATLALVAATALNDAESGMEERDYTAWYRVASVSQVAAN